MRNRKFLFIALFPLLLLLLIKFHHHPSQAADSSYSEPREIASITESTLAEISGMTAARTARGYWWMHNDSGDSARLYLVDARGALRGKFTVRGARNRDWEDMASGPGRDGKPALYIGDIGDNGRVTLEKVQGKAVEQISRLMLATGAAASPDGRRVVIRTYFTALELIRPANGEFESIFNSTPTTLRIAAERQGEAICYSRDGAAILTTSEKVPAPIYEMKRLP